MKLPYDNSIKPGDIITGYMTGFWIVDKIEDRSHIKDYYGQPTNPLHECVKVLTPDGDKSKRLRGHWDACYSTKMSQTKVAEMKASEQAALDKRFTALENLINQVP